MKKRPLRSGGMDSSAEADRASSSHPAASEGNPLWKRPDRKPIEGLRLAAGDDRLPGIEVALPPGRHGSRIEARVLSHPVLLQLLQQLRETAHPATPEVDGAQPGQFNRRFIRCEVIDLQRITKSSRPLPTRFASANS